MYMYICVYLRASKAKVLRLEKEARELEKTTESLRQSQAKAAELDKANKKLYSQTHTDRKEIIKLREVSELHVLTQLHVHVTCMYMLHVHVTCMCMCTFIHAL